MPGCASRLRSCVLASLTLVTSVAQAGDAQNPYLARAERALHALDARGALRLLDRALAWPGNTRHDMGVINLDRGLAYADLALEKQTIDSFRQALLLEPELTLPKDVSPRVLAWWKKAGGGTEVAAVKAPEVVEPPPHEEKPAWVPVAPEEKPPEPHLVPTRSPPPRSAWHTARPFVSGGLALLAGGAGLAGLFVNQQAQKNASAAATSNDIARAEVLEGKAQRGVRSANIFFGGALVGVAGAAVVWAF